MLTGFDVCLISFFALPDEITQHSYLIVVVLVEIEAITMAETDLEEIIVKAFLTDLNLTCGVFEGIPNLLVFFVDHPRIKLAPFDDLIDDMAYASFLSPSALALLCHFISKRTVFLFSSAQVFEGH